MDLPPDLCLGLGENSAGLCIWQVRSKGMGGGHSHAPLSSQEMLGNFPGELAMGLRPLRPQRQEERTPENSSKISSDFTSLSEPPCKKVIDSLVTRAQ